MIKFIKDTFRGINSSDGLESTVSLIMLVGVIIPGAIMAWCIVHKIITLIF